MAKSIGLNDGVYLDLLAVKHDLEKQEGNIVSYDKVIDHLIKKYRHEDSNKEDTSQKGNVSGEREEKDVLSPGGVFGGEDVSPPDDPPPPPNYSC